MKAITKAIIEGAEFCDTCGKYLIRFVYSSRNGDERCCSIKCVNKYPGLFQCYTYLYKDYLWKKYQKSHITDFTWDCEQRGGGMGEPRFS